MSPSANPTQEIHSLEAADETTPLIGAPEFRPIRAEDGGAVPPDANGKADSHGTDLQTGSESDEPPMPYLQILLLCYGSLAEPVAYFAIFPFISQMIHDVGNIPEEQVGFWAGLIESLFSLVQMVLMIFYGRMADRIGRKPVLVFSLVGVSVATALFGFSRDLWHMIFFRCLSGIFAGSVVTTRVMLSENTTKKTQGRAFSWYMFAKNLGIFIGPLVGGGLADPVKQFPKVFGDVQLFVDYPYALSTLVAGAICASGALFSLFALKETLRRKDLGDPNPAKPMSTWEVLKSPGVPTVLYVYGHVNALALAYTAVGPTFYYTTISKGGFSFKPQQISILIAIAGASQALWMLLVFAPLQRKLGTGTVLRGTAVAWPLFMAGYPILNEILRAGWRTAFWVSAPILVVLGSGVAMGFACVQLCVNDISPSPMVLGTVNALSLTVNSAIRAVMPALATSIFATGVKWGWAHGHLIWLVLVIFATALLFTTWFLPEAAEGRPEKQVKSNDDEDEIIR